MTHDAHDGFSMEHDAIGKCCVLYHTTKLKVESLLCIVPPSLLCIVPAKSVAYIMTWSLRRLIKSEPEWVECEAPRRQYYNQHHQSPTTPQRHEQKATDKDNNIKIIVWLYRTKLVRDTAVNNLFGNQALSFSSFMVHGHAAVTRCFPNMEGTRRTTQKR